MQHRTCVEDSLRIGWRRSTGRNNAQGDGGTWKSLTKESFEIAATMHDPKNQYITVFDAINDQVLTNRETPKPDPKILIARAPKVWMSGKQKEPIRDRVNELVGYFDATAFPGNVVPNDVEVRYGLR